MKLKYSIMRNLIISCLLLACFGFQGCKKNEIQKENEAVQADAGDIVNVQCYKATYENDTIDLKLNTLKSGKINGSMLMKISGAPKKFGGIKGEFRGDTLFADYTFIEGTNKNKIFKNPMAFLKRDKKLILGSGTMQTTMGVTYLVKDKPIDFERVKYKFDSIHCE